MSNATKGSELRVFSGLTIDESAEVLACSQATVSRDWKHARACLRREEPLRGQVRENVS